MKEDASLLSGVIVQQRVRELFHGWPHTLVQGAILGRNYLNLLCYNLGFCIWLYCCFIFNINNILLFLNRKDISP